MWTSPDGKITKVTVEEGEWGTKPSECSECEVLISDCPDEFLQYNTTLVIGDSDNYIRRNLDICLGTMNQQEVAKFKFVPDNVSFTIKLVRVKSNGLIYEWDAGKKFKIAENHKERGVALFKENREKDAAYRFTKALKIISSIPIDAEKKPEEVNGVSVKSIDKLKANLYNNLASYYLKKEAWLLVIDICKKVFTYDPDNVKAHYKIAVAYIKDRNFEEAEKELETVLSFEPENKAAIEYLKSVKEEIRKANVRVNLLVKKMFQ